MKAGNGLLSDWEGEVSVAREWHRRRYKALILVRIGCAVFARYDCQPAVNVTGSEGAIFRVISWSNRVAADTSGESAYLVAVTAIEIAFFSRYAETPE